MSGSFLILYIVVWILIGAVITPILFQRRGQSPRQGVIIGALCGLVGQLACLGPLWMFVWFAIDPPRRCPRCKTRLFPQGAVCPVCGYNVEKVL